jgi:ribosomal silencing factor RsfS
VRSYYDLEGMWSVGDKGHKSPKPERVGSAA